MGKTYASRKVIIAAGGTGGHLFPAQALAYDLQKYDPKMDIVFLGADLRHNAYFQQSQFQAKNIVSATFSKKKLLGIFRSLFCIQKGLIQALAFFRTFRPHLVVGFGSFYSLPTLIAARLKHVPIVLFESNVLPGKVNRFCSRWAKVSAVQFFVSHLRLKGKAVCVKMPLLEKRKLVTQKEARLHFQLHPDRLTFLIFGGSQGSQAINCLVCGALGQLLHLGIQFQVIHMVGSKQREEKLRTIYAKHNISACIQSFEKRMDLAWTAADLSISRAGAGTLAELIEFGVPGILIPFPYGMENHQSLNAAFVEEEIGGGIELSESKCSSDRLVAVIADLLSDKQKKLTEMKTALVTYKENKKKDDLAKIIVELLQQSS